MVEACKSNSIRLIPQINLLGHQSWAGKTYALLRVYPQFDETPDKPLAGHMFCRPRIDDPVN